MKAQHEKILRDVINTIFECKEKIEQLREDVSLIREEIQESFDSKTEKWQESDTGEKVQDEINALDYIHSHLDNSYDSIESASDDLENLINS